MLHNLRHLYKLPRPINLNIRRPRDLQPPPSPPLHKPQPQPPHHAHQWRRPPDHGPHPIRQTAIPIPIIGAFRLARLGRNEHRYQYERQP